MKTIQFFALLFSATLLFSCGKKDDIELKAGEVLINFNETHVFSEGEFEINFVELLEDSRCPEDAMCLWEGRAKVALEITENEMSSNFEMATENSMDLDSLLKFEYNNFEIELIEVYPIREDSNATPDENEYSVVLKIEEL